MGQADKIAFAIRIRNINTHDANLNALAGLDCFAGMASLAIGNDYFEDLEVMFDAYLKEPAPDP